MEKLYRVMERAPEDRREEHYNFPLSKLDECDFIQRYSKDDIYLGYELGEPSPSGGICIRVVLKRYPERNPTGFIKIRVAYAFPMK